jgi:hypothetical protein
MFVNCLFHEQGSNKSHRMMCKRLMIKLSLHFRQCRPNKTETLQPRERGNTESRYRFQILLNQCAICPVVYLSRVVTRAILRCTGTCGNAVITTCKFHPCNRLITGKPKYQKNTSRNQTQCQRVLTTCLQQSGGVLLCRQPAWNHCNQCLLSYLM